MKVINTRVTEFASNVDESGRSQIANYLANFEADSSEEFITTLQRKFALNLPRSNDALQFLLAMDSNNASVSTCLFEGISTDLNGLISEMDQDALTTMLHETIPYIIVKELKSIPIAIMKRMIKIPNDYLQSLIATNAILVKTLPSSSIPRCKF